MPYGTLTLGSKTFEPRVPGVYSNALVTFSDPKDEVRIKGASSPSKDGSVTVAVTRLLQKDVTVGADIERRQAVVTTTIQAMPGFTAAELDQLADDNASFITVSRISRMQQGEQ